MNSKEKKQYKERFINRAHEMARMLYRKNLEDVSDRHKYMCVGLAVKDTIIDDWIATQKAFDEEDAKTVYYLSYIYYLNYAVYIPFYKLILFPLYLIVF